MDPFYGEVRIFGFGFAPVNWAQCNGQTMSVAQYSALFAIIGIQYGGNGQTTFKLPDLQGSAVMNQGQGPGLTERYVGEAVGTSAVTLLTTQLPNHQHMYNCYIPGSTADLINTPAAGSSLSRTPGQFDYSNTDLPDTTMAPQMIGITGGGSPHENRQPYLVMNFCIALYGIFPVRD